MRKDGVGQETFGEGKEGLFDRTLFERGRLGPRENLVDSLHELKDLYGWRIGQGKDLDWSVVQRDIVHARECIQTGTVMFYDTRDAPNLMPVEFDTDGRGHGRTTAVVVYTQDATVLS